MNNTCRQANFHDVSMEACVAILLKNKKPVLTHQACLHPTDTIETWEATLVLVCFQSINRLVHLCYGISEKAESMFWWFKFFKQTVDTCGCALVKFYQGLHGEGWECKKD